MNSIKKYKHINQIYKYLVCLLLVFVANHSVAQSVFKQNNIDSAAIQKRVQKEFSTRDSILNAIKIKRSQDSLVREQAKLKLQQYRDSILNVRILKKRADSIAREEVKLKLAREKTKNDSIRSAQQRVLDSTIAVRKAKMDSLSEIRNQELKQKQALEKYRNSKAYKDSIEFAKKARKDSINNARLAQLEIQKAERNRVNDSIAEVRNKYNDSVATIRAKIKDSTETALANITKERKAIQDSIIAQRKAKLDSIKLAKKNKKPEEEKIASKKTKTDAMKLKMEADKLHAKKQQEWSNDKLLKKDWNLQRAIYQNTVTRYNYYYNAKRKYDDALLRLTNNHKDNYSEQIAIYPYKLEGAASTVGSDMDSVIKKCSFSTQIHDPRAKWNDNLYLLMGKAYLLKNDIDGAITTFQFVANEYKDGDRGNKVAAKSITKTSSSKDKKTAAFKKSNEPISIATKEDRSGIKALSHHPIRNEALLLLAKCYIESEQFNEAQSLLTILKEDKLFPQRLQGDLYLTDAQLQLKIENNNTALDALKMASEKDLDKNQKIRVEYLLGQLYAKNKDFVNSTTHFKKSLNGSMPTEMEFYAKLNIANNAALAGSNKQQAINDLEKLIRETKFFNYQNLAYLAIADLLSTENPEKAIDMIGKSLAKTDASNALQKAITFEKLGLLFYNRNIYKSAKYAYDSASFYGNKATPNPANINEINIRKEVLTDIVKYTSTIHYHDSIINLSYKSEKEQKNAAKKVLDEDEKQKQTKEEETKNDGVALVPSNVNNKSNWYFYSNDLIQKGSNEFKTKWGNRALVDDWRRANTSSNNDVTTIENNTETPDTLQVEKTNSTKSNTALNELLKKIPKNDEDRLVSKIKIEEAYYGLGSTYYTRLTDYTNTVITLDTMLKRFPETTFKQQVYYTLYLSYTKLFKPEEAKKYKALLNTEFGETEFAKLANNPNYKKELETILKRTDAYYDTTYMYYTQGNVLACLQRIEQIRSTINNHYLKAKFDLLEALCTLKQNNIELGRKQLQDVVNQYANTDEQKHAQEILNTLAKTNPSSSDSLKTNTPNNSDTLATNSNFKVSKSIYNYEPNIQHYFVIYIKNVDARITALQAGLSDYNSMKHDVEELSNDINLFNTKNGVISIKKFSNALPAKKYMNEIKNEKMLLKQYNEKDLAFFIITYKNFKELTATKDIDGYLKFYIENYKP